MRLFRKTALRKNSWLWTNIACSAFEAGREHFLYEVFPPLVLREYCLFSEIADSLAQVEGSVFREGFRGSSGPPVK